MGKSTKSIITGLDLSIQNTPQDLNLDLYALNKGITDGINAQNSQVPEKRIWVLAQVRKNDTLKK